MIMVVMMTIKYDGSDSRWTNKRRDDLTVSGLEFKSRVSMLSPWKGLSLSCWVRHITLTVGVTQGWTSILSGVQIEISKIVSCLGNWDKMWPVMTQRQCYETGQVYKPLSSLSISNDFILSISNQRKASKCKITTNQWGEKAKPSTSIFTCFSETACT